MVEPLNTLFFYELKTWNYMLNYTEWPEANSCSGSYSLTTKFGMKFGGEGIAFDRRSACTLDNTNGGNLITSGTDNNISRTKEK